MCRNLAHLHFFFFFFPFWNKIRNEWMKSVREWIIRTKCWPVHHKHKPCKMLVLIRKQPHHSECVEVTGSFQKMLIHHHQKFIWEHTHQFWRMAFLGSETKFLIRIKERIIDGSGVFKAPGNHPHSIQVSILLLKGNFKMFTWEIHISYCLTWDGWDFTKRASQSFNCILTLCRTSFGWLKELL